MRSFLKRFWPGQSRPEASQDATVPPIGDQECLGRFVYHPKDVSRSQGVAKPKVFMPEQHPETEEWETSTCRMGQLTDQASWDIGDRIRGMSVVARADIDASGVVDSNARCQAAPQPDFDEHAVIVGWPNEKEAQKAIAAALAYRAALVER
ncbi:hypothetical protein R69619_01709 [Paraburkholderia nemoris]|nr:hypothetical protein R69619_01709 [Paraburkholderia nemoris]